MPEYEAVIGLEVHVQLKTASKMFTDAPTGFAQPPNSLTNAIVMGLPGALPVLNKGAIEQAIRMGLIFNCEIPEVFQWDRKNYFYPDSPKNYQLTQMDAPVCMGGEVEIELSGPSRNQMGEHKIIHLDHAHLEEDVGKLTHFEKESLVDYNRAGTPLLEIVTQPDLRSADEAVALLQSIRMHLMAAGVSDCDMEKGQMRCDANVSVRPKGQSALNNRAEMKNLNSITGVKNAINYEIKRQSRAYDKGKEVPQETRRWDADASRTTSMRSKEEAHDYRYFPDPDLLPVRFPRSRVEELKASLPEGVFVRQRRYMEAYSLPYTVTSVICYDHELTGFFEEAMATYNKNPKALANYIANELQRERAQAEGDGMLPMEQVKLVPGELAGLVRLIDEGKLTKHLARDVLIEMFSSGKSAESIIEEKGIKAEPTDSSELEQWCRDAVAGNAVAAQQVRDGNEKAVNSFMGPIMKASKGKANPQAVRDMLLKIIAEG
ncbi:Asp-tRNA(Asn)/Glu-tRNA(Gln) amidotransferase subunit GatB [Puniceicoccales bacterium CK1056]|uniref:Aspartyl/glutamyl-tRNA(Asn/Gln) amidotransferase subunit B n=1 Tax=Oceanipulchritudo coccoides TaxID=2706888 RepID=A0A6B2LZV1_9BACT|nr:Asp-tRNA(Asn)/Glu-tRNA(Gln) amidotransferase subunit GatB [Oceanipulchritudo coccoides]NDV62241.1 Asp-tRNA(Asn)/Glu-tRNA(Gln) amidotransferase subunit GatB [Oceanipulchritudo coccoides]